MRDIEWCIDYLKKINKIDSRLNLDEEEAFRSLQNITMPINLSDEFYDRQDKVLQDILKRKKIINVDDYPLGLSIYLGDITLINSDAVVNACNNEMLGCFIPNHHCIDNAIHSFAGLEVRRDMMKIMEEQGHLEENGKCKVTKGYNLPSRYIFHTVGPIYSNIKQDYIDLENCYYSCLKKADEMNLSSITFCSIATGLYGFPINEAAKIACKICNKYLKEESKHLKRIIFDVFSQRDYDVYNRIIKTIN